MRISGLPWWLSGKESSCQGRRHGFDPWSGEIPHALEQLSQRTTAIEPVLQRQGATTTEPWPAQLKPLHPRACASHNKSRPKAVHTPQPESAPLFLAGSLQLCPTLRPYGPEPTRLLCPWDSPDKNNGGGRHALLQGLFLTQGLNSRVSCLPNWQVNSLQLTPPGKPRE